MQNNIILIFKLLIIKIDKFFFRNFFYNSYTKFSYNYILNRIKKNKLIYKISDHNNNFFYDLCQKYKTDKGYSNESTKEVLTNHSYYLFYNDFFLKKRNEISLLFELGIGSSNMNIKSNMRGYNKPGNSLRVFKEFFPNAHIYGGDIDKNILFTEKRIKTFYVDSLNQQAIGNLWKSIKIDKFDIIIDDGLHTYESNINFFLHSYKKLKSQGYYIIEDIHYKNLNKTINFFEKYNYKLIVFENSKFFKKDSHIIVIIKD